MCRKRRDAQAAGSRVNRRFRFPIRVERLWWEWLKAPSNSRAGRRSSKARPAVNKADPRKLKPGIGDVTGPRNGDFAGLFFFSFAQIAGNLARDTRPL